MQQKWLMKLLGFDYKTLYKRGPDNVVADPLSRIHEQPQLGTSAAISILVSQWKEDALHSWNQDPYFVDVLAIYPKQLLIIALQEGDLRFKGLFVVGQMGDIRRQIIRNLHSGAEGGHSDRQTIIKRINSICWWPKTLILSLSSGSSAIAKCVQTLQTTKCHYHWSG